MAKNLNQEMHVNLSFTADTGKAKAQLKDLQNQLTKVVNLSAKDIGGNVLAQDIEKASLAAAQLKAHLEDATNVDTGKLDLGRLSQSLDARELKKYRDNLERLGPTGQKVFLSFAQSIQQAELPLKRTNALMSELWTTMKNTARWQLTSSAMHGFMSAVSSAYGYAKDLNESLNNIRIVSGQSTEQMAKFAEEANKAARILNTTTTSYTNAALIYYQQGLSDEEIKKRTDITIKMANVARQSAEVVSDQLTAVWNNFYKEGEDSLQRYADVMTALGAATASSTDEIAGGLEKFASIADMIGLSFDYAASSLATITATTRQSEEVVGTALKTIFARIQGLKLGETLEDGTDLNKYSESLQRVGIQIFDTMGELKDMDNILEEIGARWEYLGKSEQVALAQAVAGIRQYNQLVSLMDNWDYFQENLAVARSSEGTLDEQAEIFEESWEAASNRVRAAMESIYSDIINDEAFIDMLNTVEKIVNALNKLIDSMGGLKGVIAAIGVVGTRVFKEQISSSLEDLSYNISMSFGSGKKKAADIKTIASQEMSSSLGEGEGIEAEARATMIHQYSILQKELMDNSSKMNSREETTNKFLLDRVKLLQEIATERLKEISIQEQQAKKETELAKMTLLRQADSSEDVEKYTRAVNDFEETSIWHGRMARATDQESIKGRTFKNNREVLEFLEKNEHGGVLTKNTEDFMSFLEDYSISVGNDSELYWALEKYRESAEDAFRSIAEKAELSEEDLEDVVKKIRVSNTDLGGSYTEVNEDLDNFSRSAEEAHKSINSSFGGTVKTFGDNMVHLAGNISAVIMGLNSFANALDILNDPDLTTLEKIQSIFGILITTLPFVITSMKEVAAAIKLVSSTHVLETVNLGVLAAAKMLNIKLTEQQTKAYRELYEEQKKEPKTRNAGGKKIYRSKKDIFQENQKNADIKKIKEGEYIDPSKYKTSTLVKGFVQEIVESKGGIQGIIKALGLLGVKVGVVGAAVGVAAFAWTKYQQSLPEYKLKVATKAFEDLKTASEQVHTELDELTSMFDSYTSAVEALSQCTTGTEKWNEALLNVKKSAGEILQEFPELLEYQGLYNDDGTLNQEVVERAIADKQKGADEISRAVLAAQATQTALQVQVDKRELTKELEREFLWSPRILREGETVANRNYDPLVEGLIEKYNSGDYTYEAFMEVAQNEIKALGFASKQAEEEIAEYIPQIIKLANATKNAEQGLNNIAKLNARENIGVDATQEQISDYEKAFNDNYDKLYEEYKKNGITRFTGKGDAQLKDLWDTYTESIGTELKLAENEVIHTAEGLAIQYYNEAGEVQQMSLEALVRYKAQVEANAEATNQARMDLEAQLVQGGFKDADKIFKDDIDLTVLNSFVQNIALSEQELLDNTERIKQMYPEITEDEIAKMQSNVRDLVETLSSDEFRNMSAAEQQNYLQKYIDMMPESERQQVESQKLINSAVNNYDLNAKDLEDQSARIQEYYEELQLTQIEATKLAVENQRMNKGVEELHENWMKWGDALRKANLNKENKLTTDYTDTVQDLTKAIAKMVGAADNLKLPDEFFESEENLNNIAAAARGSEEAINKLGIAVGKELVDAMEMVGEETATEIDGQIIKINQDDFEAAKNTVLAGIAELQQKMAEGNIAVGDSLDKLLEASGIGADNWIEALNQMALATNMSVEEMNQLLGTLGVEAEVSMTSVPQTVQVPKYKVITKALGFGEDGFGSFSYETKTVPMGTEEVEGAINVAQIGVNGEDPGQPKVKFIGNGPVSPSSTNDSAGGGGGKPKQTRKSDIVERYKEITDQLNDVGDAANDVSKEMDRLYGANKLAAMTKQNTILEKEIELLKKKKAEAEAYLEIDKQELAKAAGALGVSLEIGEDGNISNYTTVMTGLYNQLHALEVGAGENANEYEKKAIEDLQEKIDNLQAAINQYDETQQVLEDETNNLDDTLREKQDLAYDKLIYKLELKVELNELELEKLDLYLNRFQDNFYKMAEAAALLFGTNGELGKAQIYADSLNDYAVLNEFGEATGGLVTDLADMYERGDISQSHYIEGLTKTKDGIIDNLNSLIDLDREMMNYYENTLSMANDELAEHTDHLEHITSVFSHYLSLMDLLGKKKDYDSIGDFLLGKADTIRDRLDIAKDYYNILLEQKNDIEAKLQYAQATHNEEMIELYEKEWDAIVDATDQAQEQVLSLTEEWVSAMKEVVQNNLTQIAETLENSLTKGIGFDSLMDGFNKLNTRQEEYLTKTNQIYETNKLMRTAAQDLDRIDNTVAKQKIKNFITETKNLQQNTKLSKYELEIQQAKYDLLLAEIALEEAQNAKSTVRLAQDNEGNFGYVFTADPEEVDNAQQELEDAENRLYNISLEGQQEYVQKYLQAQQEMYNELTALEQAYLDGDIATKEEYERRKEEILNHYLNPVDGILTTYSNLYNVAVRTDADATADYWAKDYAAMTQNTEEWKDAVNEYLVEVEDETENWKEISEQANADVKGALDDSAEATDNLRQESENLTEQIREDLLPQIDLQIKAVKDVTDAYANERDEIRRLIEMYSDYIQKIRDAIAEQQRLQTETEKTQNVNLKQPEVVGGENDNTVGLDGTEGEDDPKPNPTVTNTETTPVYKDNYAGQIGSRISAIYDRNDKVKIEDGNDYVATYKLEDGKIVPNTLGTKILFSPSLGTIKARKQQDGVWYYTTSGQGDKIWIKEDDIQFQSYDTGGFTGNWGPEGKLAFLHEKEIVLNAEDTQNILTTVSFVRDLASMIDSQAKTASLMNLSAYSGIPSTGQTLEQQVSIHAEFPNATDRYEIEEAFNSLVNKASQYANRK